MATLRYLDFERFGARLVVTRNKLWLILLGAGIAAAVLAVAISYHSAHGHKAPETTPSPILSRNVERQLSGYNFTRSEGGRQIFTIRAARTVDYGQGGKTMLEGVHVEIFGRRGKRRDSFTAERCQNDAQSGSIACFGKAEIELRSQGEHGSNVDIRQRQPLYLETSDISYDPRRARVETADLVTFHFGPAQGTAVGLAYATTESRLWLERNVMVTLPARSGTPNSLPLHLAAGSLFYDKGRGEIDLKGPVRVIQGKRSLTAPAGTIYLDSKNRVTRALLNGGVEAADTTRANGLSGRAESLEAAIDPSQEVLQTLVAKGGAELQSAGPITGNLRRVEADQMRLDFAGSPAQAKGGKAWGNVKVTFTSSAHSHSGLPVSANHSATLERKTLTTPELDFTLRPGKTLEEAHTRGAGVLDLSSGSGTEGARRITAGQFTMAFDSRGRMNELRGSAPTRVIFFPPAGHSSDEVEESSADHLDASLDVKTEALETFRQWGGFHFRQGERQATAEEATYAAGQGTVILTGHPLLWEADGRIRADRFVMQSVSGAAEGFGNVQSTSFGEVLGKSPSSGKSDGTPEANSVYVLGDQVRAWRKSQRVRFQGHVRAWSSGVVIDSPALELDRQSHRLSSDAGVVTTLLQPAPLDPSSPANEKPSALSHPVTIRAKRLDYSEDARHAVYLGAPDMVSGETRLTADRIDIYFSQAPSGNQLELDRATAEGTVRITQPGRLATGRHAEYFAVPGKIVLTGGPPALVDAQQGYTTGRRLTFFLQGASLFVDGGDKLQTLSKRRIVHE